jgi:hypothetical protein
MRKGHPSELRQRGELLVGMPRMQAGPLPETRSAFRQLAASLPGWRRGL